MRPMPPDFATQPTGFPWPGATRAPESRAPPRNDPKAIASFVLGLVSVVLLGVFVTGIPAVVFGALALRDIQRDGRKKGTGLAVAGLVMGAFGVALGVILAVAGLVGSFVDRYAPIVRSDDGSEAWPASAGVRTYGTFAVVDPDEDEPLAPQIAAVVESEAPKGRVVVLHTCARSSRACLDLAATLTDERVQQALAGVTIVRVDVDAYEDELHALRVETETMPWFYRLDVHGHVADALSGEEWPSPAPANVAPILGSFAHGNLMDRRTPSPLGIAL